jgi:hypothetical protein
MSGLAVSIASTAIGVIVKDRFYFGALSRYGFTFLALVAGALLSYVVTLVSLAARGALVLSTQAVAEGPTRAGGIEGSFILGFLAGFFGGCIGLGLVLAIAKGPQTKRGAGIGFSAQVLAGIVLNGVRR